MNKIIIDPHYCTREEYESLKNYLDDQKWDWKEVKEPEGKVFNLAPSITFTYNDGYDGEPNEIDIEHITKLIEEGYIEGELITSDENHESHNGWWKVYKHD